jgi:UDP-glucose 6-dehydrogenase
MKVVVVARGYVGTVTAACLASKGPVAETSLSSALRAVELHARARLP